MAKITDIQGIGEQNATALKKAGVGSVEALREKGATRKGRQELATASGVSPKLILKWVNHADLFRIKGMAGQFSELLEAAGVDTVKELAMRNAANLHAKVTEINAEKNLTRRVPALSVIEGFIAQAKELPRVVEY